MTSKLTRALSLVALAACMSTLIACGPSQPPSSAPTAVAAPLPQVSVEPVAVTADQMEPRYTATLAEGIAFERLGYPSFVASVSGISGPEDWGRWTDAVLAPKATVELSQPLSGDVSVKLIVRDYFGINLGEDVTVSFGGQVQNFKLTDAARQQVDLKFVGVQEADKLVISVPHNSEPTEAGARSPGIGLIAMSFEQ